MKLLLKKIFTSSVLFLTFFRFFFMYLMSLKFWFKSFNLLHISFSVFFILFLLGFFFFFFNFIFLGNLPSFYFYFFNAFLASFSSASLKTSIFIGFCSYMFRYEYIHNFEDFSPTVQFFLPL